MECHDGNEAKQDAFEKFSLVFQKELSDLYMNNLVWMKAFKKRSHPQKNHGDPRLLCEQQYVNQHEAIAAAVQKRKFLLKRLLEDQGRFLE